MQESHATQYKGGAGRRPAQQRLGAPGGAQSIDRAASLLRLLASHHAQGIHLQQIVELSGLNRTTAHRILASLVHAGLASRSEPQQPIYRLGIETMALGIASMTRTPLLEACRPAMQALARRSGEAVFLVLRSGDYSHCLHVQEGARPNAAFVLNIGHTRLLGLGIPSFALLARMSDAEFIAHYMRNKNQYLARRVTESQLLRWIRLARDSGYAHINAQGLGGVGLHLPVGSCGDAAMGIVTESRLPRAAGKAFIDLLTDELKAITPKLQGVS